jgi:phosphoribosylformylglycinamidine synthase subunit PurS
MTTAKVFVTLKPEVLDPAGQAIARALVGLGFADVADARVGKYIEIRLKDGDAAAQKKELEKMCERLLANPVIERFTVEIAPPESKR